MMFRPKMEQEHMFITIPETKAEKIRTVIELCMRLNMPIPEQLLDWWNEEIGQKTWRKPER